MAKSRKISDVLSAAENDEIISMPLTTYEEYMDYNVTARKANHKLGYCKYVIKPCPEELHPTQRVIFNRNDQPNNPLPVYLRNEKIEYKKTLVPGKEYDLPVCVIEHLSERGTAQWEVYDNPDGSRDTRISHKTHRFSLRTSYAKAS